MPLPPPTLPIEERVALATRCRDCDVIPKVAEAGRVVDDPSGERVQIMHNGLKVVAGGYHGGWMSELIERCQGHHEGQEERMFHEVLKVMPAEARMIELGAFWAYYTLWFLKDHPRREALVIEPDPANLAVGRRNAALNGLAPDMLPGFAGADFSPEEAFATEQSGVVRIPRYSVRHLMEAKGWPRLDLLHLDIQGAETDVLRSIVPLLIERRIDWVFVSTHAHQISGDPLTHQRCLALLQEAGGTIEAEHDVHESFSGDGLIVARFREAPAGWSPVPLSYNRASQALFRHLAYDLAELRGVDRL